MVFNNKKRILSQVLTICIFSSLITASNCFAVEDTPVGADDNSSAEVSVENNNDDTKLANETQTSIISKFDFENEIQSMIDTYKNLQETQKSQAKLDIMDFIEQLLISNDYSIDQKSELGKNAITDAVLNNVFSPVEGLQIKQNLQYELNRQADIINLELTIKNILNSTVSISSKKDFCLNALELSMLSETISQDEYDSKVSEVESILKEQQVIEEERIAKEEADRLAREEQAKIQAEELARQRDEELARQKAIQEKAEANTIDTSVDTSSLQTVPPMVDVDTESIQDFEDTQTSNEVQVPQLGFNGCLTYTEQDFMALCNVVQHEVGNCSTLSKKMVASVVINRALSGIFPSSIYDVVNQQNQFTGIGAYINRTDYATEDTKYWCQYVLDNGVDYSNGAIYYYAPQWCGYMSYFENMTLVAEHDGQRYFK